MTSTPLFPRLFAHAGLLGVTLAVAACANLDQIGSMVPTALSPYRMDIVQGNVITREQLAALNVGAARDQVLGILGTPLLASPFHADRWDYTFTIKRQGVPAQERHVSVFFKGERLERIEADALPSEADFVASLRKPKTLPPAKTLEASEAALAKYPAPAASPAVPAQAAPGVQVYPPLEPPKR